MIETVSFLKGAGWLCAKALQPAGAHANCCKDRELKKLKAESKVTAAISEKIFLSWFDGTHFFQDYPTLL
ncbi:MAG: hypothetical protein IPG07_21960 [Crocinitomicaceae bacterium]|nr:hypothetical protein [Crocinitomicaceae bacterium]